MTATISGLKITGGSFANGFGGGGITNYGTLTLSDAVVTGNSVASGSYGAGGIFNAGTLTIAGSSISNNSGDFGSGINNNGPLTITDSSISDNSATPNGSGVAIFSFADTELTDCVVSGNTDGGISIAGSGYGPSATISTLTVSGSTIEDNSEDSDRGPALRRRHQRRRGQRDHQQQPHRRQHGLELPVPGRRHPHERLVLPVPGANILTITGSTFAGNQAVIGLRPQQRRGDLHRSVRHRHGDRQFVHRQHGDLRRRVHGRGDGLQRADERHDHRLPVRRQPGGRAGRPRPSSAARPPGGRSPTAGPSSPLTITGSTFAHNQALDGATAGFGIGGAIINQVRRDADPLVQLPVRQ